MPIDDLSLALELQKAPRGFFVYDDVAVVYSRQDEVTVLRDRLTNSGFSVVGSLNREGRSGIVCSGKINSLAIEALERIAAS